MERIGIALFFDVLDGHLSAKQPAPSVPMTSRRRRRTVALRLLMSRPALVRRTGGAHRPATSHVCGSLRCSGACRASTSSGLLGWHTGCPSMHSSLLTAPAWGSCTDFAALGWGADGSASITDRCGIDGDTTGASYVSTSSVYGFSVQPSRRCCGGGRLGSAERNTVHCRPG